mmetsp:Transcript_89320/g.257594  ORF Transcript_89320/g.257594 Transcript_89320/m.257594 type:complete len:1087 (-) Transcript_89320:64-3324(-)
MSLREDDDADEALGGDSGSSGSADRDGELARSDPEAKDTEETHGDDFEINEQSFEELRLDSGTIGDVQSTWIAFLQASESRETAGEAIYTAVFDAAPSFQALFKTPRAVMAVRFMNGLNQIVTTLEDPRKLKIVVETLGFQHMDREVTQPRLAIFRDAVLELLTVELGARWTERAHRGWLALFNYAGGSFIYVRHNYKDRLRILAASWAIANKTEDDGEEVSGEDEKHHDQSDQLQDTGAQEAERAEREKDTDHWGHDMSVPTNFNDMFIFNAAVMGFAKSTWMNEVLASFDTIVRHVSNSYRLHEECDVLSLRLAKYKGEIDLSTYKAVMLASLRSLCRDWNADHEVAWSWLWDNVERLIAALLGKPARMMRALDKLWSGLEDKDQDFLRTEVFQEFFSIAPTGQDFFKQSASRLNFIVDHVVSYTLDMYQQPKHVVEDLSALGLRHVGYGIPTEMVAPFCTAYIMVVRKLTDDEQTIDAFSWSLNLVSRILCRVISEGSTVVMRAINANSAKRLRKAVACAPRGKRAMWMLSVQVGTQSISPLMWAIETGSLDAAKAILVDLLTIRADRDRYYFGMDILFERHPDVVQRLCLDAPGLLSVLLDGLVWRSRLSENGMRRVNYYVKHLLLDGDGNFAQTLEWLVEHDDPKIICHPAIVMVSDIAWHKLAFKIFLSGKIWFLFTLLVFVVSQSVLNHLGEKEEASAADHLAMFVCRCFIYNFSLGQWIYYHVKHAYKDLRAGQVIRIARMVAPAYLQTWQDKASLALTILLLLMFAIEPILTCIPHMHENFPGSGIFTQLCPQADGSRFVYSLFSMGAMMMYFLLLIDLSVFSTRISAFVLMIIRVLSEVMLFLFALLFFLLAFACAVSTLEHANSDFSDIPQSGLSLLKVTLGMMGGGRFDRLEEDAALFVSVILYVIVTVVFLINMLVAQLNSEYQATYQDMVGFARLNRCKMVIESMPSVSKRRWEKVVQRLRLDEPCEFGEGDVGLAGGIQVFEPASANPTTKETIRRFGGSTSPAAQWPAEDAAHHAEETDRFERIERLIEKTMKRMSNGDRRKNGGGGSDGGSINNSSSFADESAFKSGSA